MLHGVLFVLTLHLAPCLQKWCFSSPACMRSSLQWYACDNIWPQKDVEGCHGMKFPVCFLCLWGRVIPLADNEQETSLAQFDGDIWASKHVERCWRRHCKIPDGLLMFVTECLWWRCTQKVPSAFAKPLCAGTISCKGVWGPWERNTPLYMHRGC